MPGTFNFGLDGQFSTYLGWLIPWDMPLTLLAGLGHWYLGTINFALLESLLAGSIPGIILGSYSARYAPDALLKILLGAILFAIAILHTFATKFFEKLAHAGPRPLASVVYGVEGRLPP